MQEKQQLQKTKPMQEKRKKGKRSSSEAIKIIGLTGPNGAGKGEAAAFFRKKGFLHFSLSDLIREEIKRKGLDLSRNNLIKTGNEMRETGGPDILAKRVLQRIQRSAVIDSIRNPKEVEHLKSHGCFVLLAIDAPAKIRFQRVRKRGRNESVSTFQEFMEKEGEEKTNNLLGQQLQTCIKMADFRVVNNGSLSDLHKKLEKFL